jgi:hypothetical protein
MKDEVAVYKLIESDKDDLTISDEKGKPRKRRPGYTICGKKEIYDPIQARSVTIMNKVKTKKTKSVLGDIITTTPDPLRFLSDKPAIHVTHDSPETYAFIERLDENRDNPYRNKSVAPIFCVDHRKKISKELEKDMFMLEAMNWVATEATYDQLKVCAEGAMKLRPDVKVKTDWKDKDASVGYEMLKRELLALAKDDPTTIIKTSAKSASIVKLQIQDAESFRVIMYADGKEIKSVEKLNQWFHNDENLTTICTVPVGKNKYDALLDFFKTPEGAKHCEKMNVTLSKILNR